ncbi:MAG: hypothetical protein ACRBFS_24070 [Aureispira sp.]
MFKSKLSFKVFDKKEFSAPHLTTVTVKNRARACCGKMSNSLGTTTPFHLILDYFDDQPGEPKGHFIDFGTHTTLQKHFEKIETRPGGTQKRFSGGVKQVATGVAFVEEKGGQQVVYFVPLQSKIPKSGWNKFLKKSKSILGNRTGIMLTEKEWQAMKTEKKAPSTPSLEVQLAQFKVTLNALVDQKKSLSKEALELQKVEHKKSLQDLIEQYNNNKSKNGQTALQEIISLWKSILTIS